MKPVNWHAVPYETAVQELGGSETGLSSAEAAKRFQKYGANRLQRKRRDGPLIILWRQINNPLIGVLIASSLLAVLLGKVTDGLVVLAVVIINSIIGFVQEFRAGRAIEALTEMVPEKATILRDGQKVSLPVLDIVPGDVVELAAGDRVPADMRLMWQKNLTVEEAALTGESLPARKSVAAVEAEAAIGDRSCLVYSGTLTVTGTGTGIVVATGMDTELGKISGMLSETTDLETPLTQKLAVVGQYLTIGILVLTLAIMAIGTVRAAAEGVPLTAALKDSLIFAIALAVGAIPEGLPAVVTIALAIGVQRMARRQAIIRKLPAVETLGSTTVICSDKTGTLTRNEMTVRALWTPKHDIGVTGVGYNTGGAFQENGRTLTALPEDIRTLLMEAALCNDSGLKPEGDGFAITGDPTEAALLVAAAKAGMDGEGLRKEYVRADVLPFDSERQYMATLHRHREYRLIVKGAPEVVIKRCRQGGEEERREAETVFRQMEIMGGSGMRILAVARKILQSSNKPAIPADEDLDGLEFVGLIGMIDPPRTEALDAVAACHAAGITVKMITGDHPATARSIGMDLGLSPEGEVVTGRELAKMDDQDLARAVRKSHIFARVAPEHKLRLVRSLQQDNQIVAMTGDGVNDAPSLKQANIGVAMGITGTSVSKEAADIVLADDNFASIGAAVEEGRRVYDNLIKSLAFLLPTNLGLAFILIYGIMFFPFQPETGKLLLPMLPTQLLWINLVAAVALALPLAFEAKEARVMKRPPRRPDAPLFNSFVTFRVILVSLLMTAGTIFVFQFRYAAGLAADMPVPVARAVAQTTAVTFVILFQIFYMLNCRSLTDSIRKIGLFSNLTIFPGIGTVLLLQAVFVYTPVMHNLFGTASLRPDDLLLAAAGGFAFFPIIGVEKWGQAWRAKKKRYQSIW